MRLLRIKELEAQLARRDELIRKLDMQILSMTDALHVENQAATNYARQVEYWIGKFESAKNMQSNNLKS